MISSRLSDVAGATGQIALVMFGLAAAVLAPPANGALMAIPLTGATAAETINVALAHGARIYGAGPLAGSIVLRGERDRLAGPLRARGIVLLAGSPDLCR